jgi:AcrR family transcriptional regulator
MGRPKSYDQQDVLKKAMKQFWKTGFAETSLSDLEQATGLNRYSLYKGFGDKEALYSQAMEFYYQTVIAVMLQPLRETPSGYQALQTYFAQLNNLLKGNYGQYGCMIQNMQKEGIAEKELTRAYAARLWKEQSERIQASLETGEFNLPLAIQDCIQLLLAQIQAQISLARSHAPHALLDAQSNASLNLIKSWRS